MTQALSRAFLKQGRSDYELYEHLQKAKLPRCHWLHALQMACEKTAKAYLAAGGETIEDLKESHLVFGDYLGALRRNRAVRAFLPEKWQSGDYFWKKIRPISDAIERLVPGRHNTGLNAEYPLGSAGRIHLLSCRERLRRDHLEARHQRGA